MKIRFEVICDIPDGNYDVKEFMQIHCALLCLCKVRNPKVISIKIEENKLKGDKR